MLLIKKLKTAKKCKPKQNKKNQTKPKKTVMMLYFIAIHNDNTVSSKVIFHFITGFKLISL